MYSRICDLDIAFILQALQSFKVPAPKLVLYFQPLVNYICFCFQLLTGLVLPMEMKLPYGNTWTKSRPCHNSNGQLHVLTVLFSWKDRRCVSRY